MPGGLPPCGLVCWCVGGLFPDGPTPLWFGGVCDLACWCQCMRVPVGGCCPLWFGGVGGLVVCWWCAAWGHCPIVGWWLGCWCGGVHVCVCCLEADAPMVCLVCWLFGGLVVGGVCGVWCWCVGVCGVLLRVLHPLWLCVLVMWCVGDNVCVFLRGCCPLWVGGVGVLVVCCMGRCPH